MQPIRPNGNVNRNARDLQNHQLAGNANNNNVARLPAIQPRADFNFPGLGQRALPLVHIMGAPRQVAGVRLPPPIAEADPAIVNFARSLVLAMQNNDTAIADTGRYLDSITGYIGNQQTEDQRRDERTRLTESTALFRNTLQALATVNTEVPAHLNIVVIGIMMDYFAAQIQRIQNQHRNQYRDQMILRTESTVHFEDARQALEQIPPRFFQLYDSYACVRRFLNTQIQNNGQPVLQEFFTASQMPIHERVRFVRVMHDRLHGNNLAIRLVGEAILAELAANNANNNQERQNAVRRWIQRTQFNHLVNQFPRLDDDLPNFG